MRANRVEHLIDTDRAYLLRLHSLLNEHLLVQVVAVIADKNLSLLQQVHNVDTLVKLL